MGPYGPQPGPGPNPDWAPTRAWAARDAYGVDQSGTQNVMGSTELQQKTWLKHAYFRLWDIMVDCTN